MKRISEIKWKASEEWMRVRCIDMHTGGEPLRILIDGYPDVKGHTVLEKRKYFRENLDFLRRGLMWEPRGHADMYGAVLSIAESNEADFDVFFIHNEGYSTMCGHAIIALTKFVYETGLIESSEKEEVIFNVPAGKVYAKAHFESGIVQSCSFQNVPSYLYLKDKTVTVPDIGEVRFDVAFGGAYYAIVQAEVFGLSLDASHYTELIDYGKRIKKAVMENFEINHPEEEELSFLYGTIFTGKAHNPRHHSRNVCVFADGEVDRSATGSGVSARAALHYEKSELKLNESITIESILGSTMAVCAVEKVNFHGYRAVIPEVTGSAAFTGESVFCFDPEDPYREGFIFR